MKQVFIEVSSASGVNDPNEIATIFIKSESQQHELKVYFNELSFQLEKIQKTNEQIENELKSLNNGKVKESDKLSSKISSIKAAHNTFIVKIDKSNKNLQQIRDYLSKSCIIIAKSVELLSGKPVPLGKHAYKNITEVLKRFEEHIAATKVSLEYIKTSRPPLVNAIDLHLIRNKSAKQRLVLQSSHFQAIEEFDVNESIESFKYPLTKRQMLERVNSNFEFRMSTRRQKKHSSRISFDV